ncbi:MAG: PEP-utilizing enzyme [Candidatus Magasanikbacteria bacterium]
MNRNDKVQNLFKKLPKDFVLHCRRGDISTLSCSVFAHVYAFVFNREFGIKFSANFWGQEDRLCFFYRSEMEQDQFLETLGRRCKKAEFVNKLTSTLIKLTDWFNSELKNPSNILENSKEFFENYLTFFVYHQAVGWSGNYMSRRENRNNKLSNKLAKAYKYNELVVPAVERAFQKLKIGDFLFDELIEKDKLKPPHGRGVLYIINTRYVLNANEARKLAKLVNNKSFLINIKNNFFKGTSSSRGVYKGRVRLVLDYKKMKECKKGDVLVAESTLPQHNDYIMKVGAIITDYGSTLSHASMLARETNIPCIVDTKIATKVLKDGDMVEVDANKGIVRKIK